MDFGLILFVYSVGLTAGPSFFRTFRRRGMQFVVIALVIVSSGAILTALIAYLLKLSPALAAGALNGFGVIAAFAAYRYEGKAAIVTPLAAAVQPIVTLILALLFLGERVGLLESIGIALAIAAAIALSQESKPGDPARPANTTI